MPIRSFCPNNKDHGWVRTACPFCRYEELERKLAAAREALSDMTDLATLLDDDDPYFGDRRNATERIEKARKVLAALTEAGEQRCKHSSQSWEVRDAGVWCEDCHGWVPKEQIAEAGHRSRK